MGQIQGLQFMLNAGAEEAGRILGFDAQFLFELGFQWLNTLILFAALGFFLYKPVRKMMADRSERVKSQLEHAEKSMKNADALKLEYEEKIADIEKERNEILATTRKSAIEKSERIVGEARVSAETIRKRAEADVLMSQAQAKDEIRKQIIEISTSMAGRFVAKSIDAGEQNKLLDEQIASLGDVKWQE